MLEDSYVPFLVFGRSSGDIDKVLAAVCVKAFGLNAYQRAVELPAASREISSPGVRPQDDVLVERFIRYTQQTYRVVTDIPVLCVAYRGGWQSFSRTLKKLRDELPFVPMNGLSDDVEDDTDDDEGRKKIPRESVHILLLENAEAASQFMRDQPALGTLQRSISQGAILRMPKRGLWFVISHAPSIPHEDLGRLLLTTLKNASPTARDDDRHSVAPPEPLKEPTSSRRSSASNVLQVNVPSGSKQEPLSERIAGLLGNLKPGKKDGS